MKDMIQRIDRRLNWSWLPEVSKQLVDQAVAIQQIPAPTFGEKARAAAVLNRFQALRLSDIRIDDVDNVYGRIPGTQPDLPGVMVSAHTDTVFPASTDLATRSEGDLIYGPGLGDNSLGVSGMLSLATVLRQPQMAAQRDIWLIATSREEGLGDLGGMKAAYAHLRNRIDSVINLEGLAFGHVYHAGVAVRRLRITANGMGGHSWLHFGRPSAVHGIVALGSRILALQPPQSPRTTYNIGLIEGGQGINVIASEATLWLDLRSEAYPTLKTMEQQVRSAVGDVMAANPDLSLSVEVVGDRPAGVLSPEHTLVQTALAALSQVGVQGVLENGSTDANIPLAEGCPAITVGLTRGGNAHRLDEYIEARPVSQGLRQLVLLTLATAGYQNL